MGIGDEKMKARQIESLKARNGSSQEVKRRQNIAMI
jgi:hypothetical protein